MREAIVADDKAINELRTDNEGKNSKKILVDMLEKAVAADLIYKNVARQITTEITKEEHSMTYFSKDGKYKFEMHPTKTNKGLREQQTHNAILQMP